MLQKCIEEPSKWSWDTSPCLHPIPECLTDDMLPFREPHCKCSLKLAVAGSLEVLPLATCLELTAFQLDLSIFQSLFGKGTKQKMSRKDEKGAESSFLGNEWKFIQASFVPQEMGLWTDEQEAGLVRCWPAHPLSQCWSQGVEAGAAQDSCWGLGRGGPLGRCSLQGLEYEEEGEW